MHSQQAPSTKKDITISGKVVSNESSTPIEYATIVVSDSLTTIKGTISDKNGKFKLTVPTGNYEVIISHLGYNPHLIERKAYANNTKLEDIKLLPDVNQLEEVTITGTKKLVEIKLDKKVYNIERDKTNRGKTSTQILNTIPSVDVNAEGAISLRGNSNTRVLIDGNPSAISGNNLNAYLLQLQAESISKIEVVTNPSSKYDAEGISGIINIVLKKETSNNLGITTTLSTGIPDNHGISGSLSYRKNSLSIYSTIFYKYIDITGEGTINQKYTDANNLETFTKESRTDERLMQLLFGNAGLFYRFKNKSSMNIFVNLGRTVTNNDNQIGYLDTNTSSTNLSNRLNQEDEKEYSSDISLSYKKPFKNNSTLALRVELENSNENQDSDIQTTFSSATQENISQLVNAKEKQHAQIFQVDYELLLNNEKGQFDFGYKYASNSLKNDYEVSQFNNGMLEPLDGFSENFKNKLNINAFYTQYNRGIDKWSFTIGVRVEDTNQDSDFNTSNIKVNKNYTDLFPTAHINFNINNNKDLRFSYSRRIRRPDIWTLNPFLSFANNRNFFSGNPDLNPIYTNSFELNYVMNKSKNTLDVALYHQASKGIINYIIQQTDEVTSSGNVIFKRFPVNNGNENKTGVDVNSTLKVSDNFNVSANVNLYHSAITNTVNNLFDADQWLWFGKLSTNYKLPLGINSELTMRYRGPRENRSYESKGIFIGDVFFNKDILKGNGTLALSINDVFTTLNLVSSISQANFFSENNYKYRKRQLNFSFTYRFNKRKRNAFNRERPLKDDFEY